jgi:hypothetical protein
VLRTLPTLLSIGQFYGTSPFLLPQMLWGLFKKKSRLPKALSAYWSIETMIAWTWW